MKRFLKVCSFWIGGFICWSYIWFVALTSRIIKRGYDIPERFRKQGKGFIFCIWHNRQFFLCYPQRNTNIAALVSQSDDGEYITHVAKFFGIGTVRGSTTRGGSRALVQMVRRIESGGGMVITPDGPKGPVYEVQQGIVHVAKKTGCPIIPCSCSLKRKIECPSWDKYQIPYPFNQILIEFGEPFYLNPEESLEESSLKIKEILNSLTEKTENFINTNDENGEL